MRWRTGPRPWTINAFAVLLLGASSISLIAGLLKLDETIAILNFDIPSIDWNRDLAIVWLCAVFSIVMFPLVWIWGLGSRIARIVIAVLTLPEWLQLFAHVWVLTTRGIFDAVGFVSALSIPCAIVLIFAPSASRWLAKNEEADPETFV